MSLKITIYNNFARGKLEIYISEDMPGDEINVWECVMKVSRINRRDPVREIGPTMVFDAREGEEFLREFAQALVSSGYRDKAFDKDREIKRLETHLEDMRKITFKKLDI